MKTERERGRERERERENISRKRESEKDNYVQTHSVEMRSGQDRQTGRLIATERERERNNKCKIEI